MNFEKKNLTIIIPHPDDEILGAGGTIALYSSMGWKINALVVSGPDTTKAFIFQPIEE